MTPPASVELQYILDSEEKRMRLNEYFDTIMDDEVISLDSLHGQYRNIYFANAGMNILFD